MPKTGVEVKYMCIKFARPVPNPSGSITAKLRELCFHTIPPSSTKNETNHSPQNLANIPSFSPLARDNRPRLFSHFAHNDESIQIHRSGQRFSVQSMRIIDCFQSKILIHYIYQYINDTLFRVIIYRSPKINLEE